MLKTLALFLLLSILCFYCFAQERSGSQIGIGTGYAHSALRNELISPYKYVGATMPFQLSYRLKTPRSKHHVQIFHALTNLSTAVGVIGSNQTLAYTQYAFHRRTSETEKKLNIFVGLVFDTKYSHRQNTLEDGSPASNDQQTIIMSLSPSFYLDKSLNKSQMSFQFWTTLFSYAFHNGYALSYPNEWSFLFSNKYLEINSRISYSKYLFPRLDARLDYQFQYFKLSKHEPIMSLNNQLIVSFIIKLYTS